MDWLFLFALRLVKMRKSLIIHFLFARQDEVKGLFGLLESLGLLFDPPVPVQNVKHSVLRVQLLVFLLQVFVNEVVGSTWEK